MSAITARIGRFYVTDHMAEHLPAIGQACQITRLVHDGMRARYEVFATSEEFDLVDVEGEVPLYDCLSDGVKIWFKRLTT